MFTHHSPTTSDIAPVGPEIVQVPDDDIIETTEMPVSPRQLLRQFSRIDQQETLRPIPDNIDDDDPLNLQPLDEGGIDPHLFSAHALLASTTAPQSYLQARHSGEWEQWEPAMQEELAKMDKYKVWEVVPRSPDMRVVGARWVFTRKIDGETGKPSAYKARWVAKGFSQIEGIDFNELFAAVAHKDSIRVFLSLVNHLDLECDQVDIKAAFLNGDLDETIYLTTRRQQYIGRQSPTFAEISLWSQAIATLFQQSI